MKSQTLLWIGVHLVIWGAVGGESLAQDPMSSSNSAHPTSIERKRPAETVTEEEREESLHPQWEETASPHENRPRKGGKSSHLIPEPLHFDLVRPLHARRGELEINSLFVRPLARQGGHLEWAPEIEYAFLDGHAIELEFPLEGRELAEYKVALQGTLPGGPEAFVHGWQTIGRRSRHAKGGSLDGLYLAGYRLHPRWSVFSMQGVRRTRTDQTRSWQPLFNPSLFHHTSERLVLGLESNFTLGTREVRSRLILPQAHWTINRRYSMQWGLGVAGQHGSRAHPVGGWRLILTLD